VKRSAALGLAAGLTLWALAAPGQQFDNFGDGPIEGFEIPPGGIGGIEVPSLGEDGSLPESGPEISLQRTEGQGDVSLTVFPGTGAAITSISQPETSQAGRVTLRALDRMLGQPTDVEMGVGETVIFGRIAIHALECRFPTDDPSSDAFVHLEILDLQGNRLFDGWMIASAPALSALEHARYDVWVLRCAAE
jgi:hypothetical protein